ncbi:MAG: AIR synthase family protein, partial [Fusobacteriaceae bacterium]
MKVGKLKIGDLKELVLNNIKNNRVEVLSNPEIGGDCAVVDVGSKLLYLSSDPITGATEGIGKLAINVNVNDIATSGNEALGVMLTILAPEGTPKENLKRIIKEAQLQCDKLNISILGGHTEITDAVNRIVISTTAIGLGEKKQFIEKKKPVSGDKLLITKGVGIEGTGIIAEEKSSELELKFGKFLVDEAKKFLDLTSVVEEGKIGNNYSKAMHDVTEGGLLGGIWEFCELFNLGAKIDADCFEISEVTKKICDFYKIDPLKLISSGTMLMIVAEENIDNLQSDLKKSNIISFVIGELTQNLNKVLIENGIEKEISEPESDELYKVI